MARLDIRGLRREQILDAAERLVLQRGWAETTLARLCEEADVSNGVLTYHFKDKEDIEQALWSRVRERWFRKLEDRFASAERLDEVFRVWVHEALEGDDHDLEVYYLLLIDRMSRAIYDPQISASLQDEAAWSRERLVAQWKRLGGVSDALDLPTAAAVVRAVHLGAVLSCAALGIPKSGAFATEVARLVTGYLTGDISERAQVGERRKMRSA